MSEQDTQKYLESISVQPETEIKEQPIHKRAWAVSKTILKNFPKWFGLYLGLCGLWGFSCFIAEEAFQTVQFASWGAFEAKEYRLIKREIGTQEKLRTTLQTINNIGGWLNPFGWYAYQGYVDAEREWIDATKAKLFANAPEVFAGEIVTFTFIPQEEEPGDKYNYYRNGRITVISNKIEPIVTGRVTVDSNNMIIIDTRE